jgi:HD-like signal output (HDOD) protein
MNHAEIGAMIAEKWNFPENLVAAIRYHHTPLDAKSHRDVIESVYLANAFAHLEDGTAVYEQLDASVLANFGLINKKQVLTLIGKFSAGFKEDQRRNKRF